MSRTAHPLRALGLTILVVLSACVATSQRAAALGLSPDPVVWTNTGFSGTITLSHDLVSVGVGAPLGGVVLAGSVGPSDVTLVFQAQVVLTGTTHVTGIGMEIFTGPTFTGAGWIPSTEPDSLTDFESGGLIGPQALGLSFAGADFPNGATSDLFFVSFTSLAPGDVIRFQPFNNQVFVDVSTPATVVPEPASTSLLALGLAFLARGVASRRA